MPGRKEWYTSTYVGYFVHLLPWFAMHFPSPDLYNTQFFQRDSNKKTNYINNAHKVFTWQMLLTASYFETGVMATSTKSQNPTILDQGGP